VLLKRLLSDKKRTLHIVYEMTYNMSIGTINRTKTC